MVDLNTAVDLATHDLRRLAADHPDLVELLRRIAAGLAATGSRDDEESIWRHFSAITRLEDVATDLTQ